MVKLSKSGRLWLVIQMMLTLLSDTLWRMVHRVAKINVYVKLNLLVKNLFSLINLINTL